MGFKLILAVSADGFIARGPDDDMKWTGPIDKALFRALTCTGGALLVGSQTAKAMPQKLPNRRLITLSRNAQVGITLAEAAWSHRDAWLIGGGTVALEALRTNLVERAFICQSKTYLGGGIPYGPIQDLLPGKPSTCNFEEVLVQYFDGVNHRGT